jgi:hypothetical protein
MDDFEEALQNIDAFCRVLVKKLVENENERDNNVVMEPMEKLLLRKYIIEEHAESSPLAKSLIPLPQAEKPLIDVFEDDNYVKVLMQCRCKDQKVTIQPDMDGIIICKRECHIDIEGREICRDMCQKLALSPKKLQIKNMIAKCNNNSVFEVDIPKANP